MMRFKKMTVQGLAVVVEDASATRRTEHGRCGFAVGVVTTPTL